MVRLARVELATPGLGTQCSIIELQAHLVEHCLSTVLTVTSGFNQSWHDSTGLTRPFPGKPWVRYDPVPGSARTNPPQSFGMFRPGWMLGTRVIEHSIRLKLQPDTFNNFILMAHYIYYNSIQLCIMIFVYNTKSDRGP